ncbi:hypothetical protein RRG08_015432 [Elysia crispata]|uniref:Uncharacterized protein n=1 Tax=Elysia crispata TaxID=231223 RepID=A0AAE0YH45_9GAST|nr:hypothetical protein RRG08_015432 [Elysia crispata]
MQNENSSLTSKLDQSSRERPSVSTELWCRPDLDLTLSTAQVQTRSRSNTVTAQLQTRSNTVHGSGAD